MKIANHMSLTVFSRENYFAITVKFVNLIDTYFWILILKTYIKQIHESYKAVFFVKHNENKIFQLIKKVLG